MNVSVRGKNTNATPALKEYVEKRLSKLDKYFENEPEAQVTLVVEKDTHKVEVTMPINGMILRGEEATGDMYASIDLVVEKMERQINRYKGKFTKKGKTAAAVEAVPHPSEDLDQVVKTKRFAIKPMPVDEALMQMNLLGHSFFVFSNAETEEVNVIYKRKDGHYGLIEPEF